ncbi:hypothetical protein L3Q82_002765 [Scortum barcoo]|uniref:Uncharacterized protein n=1 Tax=Scortum barcoo TaxID=214431 RepID=A0ACB8VUI3_9TELE|nr:hypothetical protein L3Q82_002765 [Scortum barcoo]
MSHREEASGKTQDTLERLCLSTWPGNASEVPPEELEEVSGVKPSPCPRWALGWHPRLCRYASPGQLSGIAINLSRANPSIKLFGIWQLLKGQRGFKSNGHIDM